ncbi:hypothetical protein [Photobacterium damselae]|uniref:hypothetical protein n=1 Tax=Photobacterium damselae TaxID=38293 RepID=UPI00254303B8|nr:hypothetical protein [Photobacterium damselae]WIH19330.1 hypothetical protein KQY33_14080 [Photobacterium damselae]
MTHKIAPDKYALQKRLNRFFDGSISCRKDVTQFVHELTKDTDTGVFAFGGLVRDIGLFGVREFSSDVDLVFDGHKKELERALGSLPHLQLEENKFGGFRIRLHSWDVDIWCAEDTWAIKRGLVDYKGITSLLDTTLLSWDSALFDVKKHKLICKKAYMDNLSQGKLDVVLKESPNELGSMVRITRAVYSKGAYTLGKNAIELMDAYFSTYSTKEIVQYEKNSYHKNYLSLANLENLKSLIKQNISSSEVKLSSQEQLTLKFFD